MRRRALIQAAGAATVAGIPLAPGAAEVPMPAVGSRLPLADVPLLDGGAFRAAEAKGQLVVLYWWASWCPFCAMQSPHVQKLWDAQRARGLRMLALSIDKQPEAARNYLRQRGYTFPAAWSSPEVTRAMPKPGKALPVTCVIGRDGRVLVAEDGQMFPEDVEEIARFV